MKIGILALQGAFIEHKYSLDALGAESFEIRQKKKTLKNRLTVLLSQAEKVR